MATYQELQGKNVRLSLMLVSVVAALMVSAGYIIGMIFFRDHEYAPWIAVGIAALITGIQALVSWFAGAGIVLAVSGAKEVDPNDPRFRQLYNIVEEVKIAAGIPMPRVYVIADPSPNAFATGRNPEDGRVAVTTGLMEILDREELQGVIAHELAHIKNRDILFSTLAGVMVGAVVILSDVMLRSFIWGGMRGGGDRDRGGAQAILMVVGLVFAILAPILAQLLRLAVSRQREYLADASGAHFTRNPAGLASALAKISSTPQLLQRRNHGTAHMFISDPFHQANLSAAEAASLFSTHPPMTKRIERLRQIGAAGMRG